MLCLGIDYGLLAPPSSGEHDSSNINEFDVNMCVEAISEIHVSS